MLDSTRNPRKPNPDTSIGALLIEIDRSYAWLGRQVGVRRAAVQRWAEGAHPSDETKVAVAAALSAAAGRAISVTDLWQVPQELAA